MKTMQFPLDLNFQSSQLKLPIKLEQSIKERKDDLIIFQKLF